MFVLTKSSPSKPAISLTGEGTTGKKFEWPSMIVGVSKQPFPSGKHLYCGVQEEIWKEFPKGLSRIACSFMNVYNLVGNC